jgi:hypothetical protein
MVYVAAFGAGTVAAMTAFAAAAGRVGTASHSPVAYRVVMTAAAAVAMFVGGWWLFAGAA